MTLQAGTPIGKYVVRRKIAEGGMAEIYLASVRGPEGFEKDVVIKRIRSFMSNDAGFVQMFISEARLASRLNHANIVQIFDFDKHEDSFYIAMEYVRGRSLRDVRQKCREQMRSIPPTLVAHIGLEVARALHYAHQLREKGRPVNLVHRDVTPHNVLLSWEGAVKLTDFGIAKGSNKLTAPGMLKGKFAYMSPEQARGDEVDARTDLFALGIVLWEMLTGGRLFEGDSDIAVLRSVQQSAIPPPGRLNPDVPPELDAVVMRALARDANERFQTAQELERALGQFILRHAQSIDDTDLGGFLQRLYADELGDERFDRTASGVRAPTPEELAQDAASSSEPVPARREPTAVMPGRTRSQPELQAAPVAADDDAFADTHVLQRGAALPAASPPSLPIAAESAPGLVVSSLPSAVQAAAGQPAPGPGSTGASRVTGPRTPAPPVDLPQAYALKGDSTAVSRSASAPVSGSHSVVVSPEALTPAPSSSSRVSAARPAASVAPGTQFEVASTAARADSTAAPRRDLQQSSMRRAAIALGAVALLATAGAIGFVARGSADGADAGDGPESAAATLRPGTAPEPAQPLAAAPSAPVPALAVPAAGETLPATADAGAPHSAAPDADAQPGSSGLAAAPVAPGSTPATATARQTPPVVRARGTLVVRAKPWANVYLDGRPRGEVVGSKEFVVAAGKYVVRFAHDKKTVEKVVTVREGRRESVEFDLHKD